VASKEKKRRRARWEKGVRVKRRKVTLADWPKVCRASARPREGPIAMHVLDQRLPTSPPAFSAVWLVVIHWTGLSIAPSTLEQWNKSYRARSAAMWCYLLSIVPCPPPSARPSNSSRFESASSPAALPSAHRVRLVRSSHPGRIDL
jgi:hypothetical protein